MCYVLLHFITTDSSHLGCSELFHSTVESSSWGTGTPLGSLTYLAASLANALQGASQGTQPIACKEHMHWRSVLLCPRRRLTPQAGAGQSLHLPDPRSTRSWPLPSFDGALPVPGLDGALVQGVTRPEVSRYTFCPFAALLWATSFPLRASPWAGREGLNSTFG